MAEIWKFAKWVLAIGGLIGILEPAFFENKTLTQTIFSLFQPEASLGFWMRWLLVILFLGVVYILIIDFVFKGKPITVLRTILNVKFLDNDGSLVKYEREQTLRPNRPGVTAIFSQHSPDYGKIKGDEISATIYTRDKEINTEIEKYGTDDRGYEVLQIFSPSLPYSWYMPLVPVLFLKGDYNNLIRIFRKNLVVRRSTQMYENEFDVENPGIELRAEFYTQLNISVNIKFSKSRPPTLKFRKIQDIGVTDLPPDYPDGKTAAVHVPRLRLGEAIKITWTR